MTNIEKQKLLGELVEAQGKVAYAPTELDMRSGFLVYNIAKAVELLLSEKIRELEEEDVFAETEDGQHYYINDRPVSQEEYFKRRR